MKYRVLPEAIVELDEAATWYEEHEPGLGLALVAEYRERVAFAIRMPASGAIAGQTPGGAEIRRFRLERFRRYAVLMATIAGFPTVLAVEHSSRRPGYWRARLDR